MLLSIEVHLALSGDAFEGVKGGAAFGEYGVTATLLSASQLFVNHDGC